MNRAIQPFATQEDGDVLYAVTTDEIENPSLSPLDLGVIASELAWDAILSSVPIVPNAPAPLKIKPRVNELQKYVGTYEFYGGSKLLVSLEGANLTATLKGNGRIYFDNDSKYQITPAEDRLFIIESPARDVLRFDESGGVTTGPTMNPGPWPIRAKLRR
jgi:6-aminohexanoate-oligomer endohydrolase